MPPVEFVYPSIRDDFVGENASFRPDGIAVLLGEKQLHRYQETSSLVHVSIDAEVLVRGRVCRNSPDAVLDGTEVLHAASL